MLAAKYFKLHSDTSDGEGVFYYEVKGGEIVRQVCVVHGELYWADENEEADEDYGFPDQPQFVEAEIPDYAGLEVVTGREFEALWGRAKSQ
ncbi:MAG: hypothetical protein R3C59_08925 [Planctomycetaceae bacterium]